MAASDVLKQLLNKYADGLATGQEQEQLFALITQSNDEDLQSSLIEILSVTQPHYDEQRRQRTLNELLSRINENRKARIIPMRRKWIKWVAAACIIIAIATLAVVGVFTNNHKSIPAVATTHDVPAPTNTRAVITLADGSKVYLDSAGNGTIAQQNDVAVVKDANGGIKYLSPAGGGAGGMSPSGGGAQRAGEDYNTLFNPRGSKVISLTLSDGTKVWLNAESSLRYPASFANSEAREVFITGEAYFEVAHIARGFNPGKKNPTGTRGFSPMPFKVHLPNGSVVEDIGTSFNINAYPDEEATKTTLIEGSIKISAQSADKNLRNQREKILKPGEQLVQSPDHQITTSPDVDEVMAWKNGKFSYTNSGLETIMRQMARWYDVDVIYKDRITDRYTVDVPRTVPVSQLFKFIEMSGGVHFSIEGKKITVTK